MVQVDGEKVFELHICLGINRMVQTYSSKFFYECHQLTQAGVVISQLGENKYTKHTPIKPPQYLVEECEDYRSIRMLKSFLLIFILFIVVDHVELYWVADSVYLVFGPTIVADAPMPVCLYKPVLDSGWKRAGTYGMSCWVVRVVMENCASTSYIMKQYDNTY